MKTLYSLVFLAGCFAFAKAQTYRTGACPAVEPMQGFQMNRFLGLWYVIEKSATTSHCITYNYALGKEPGEYVITQGIAPLKPEHQFTGELTVLDPRTPALMQVRFPLGVGEGASHVVFTTDYDTYAGIFTCQNLPFTHRQSVTILSRYRNLDRSYVEAIRAKLSYYGVDLNDLNIISQFDCSQGNSMMNAHIDPLSLSLGNVGNVVRNAGIKLGSGVQWVTNAGSKVLHKLTGEVDRKITKLDEFAKELINDTQLLLNGVLWIP